jgi:nitrate/nitrite transport system ATP-binding protein
MGFLELRGVCKGYATDVRSVLADVDLDIEEGELVAVVGTSGSGKTTLLSILAGLIRPDRGTAHMAGRPIRGPGPERAVVFQSYALLPWSSVLGNVQLAVDQVHPGWSRRQRRERAEEYLATVNLSAARDKRPDQLSGGMRQRVSLARALALEPACLLMDEPLSALDALTRGMLQDEIERLFCQGDGQKKTVLLVTNDVDEAIRLADRIVPLGRGPGASLGASIAVNLPRPRDRQLLRRDPRVLELRERVLDCLRARPLDERLVGEERREVAA